MFRRGVAASGFEGVPFWELRRSEGYPVPLRYLWNHGVSGNFGKNLRATIVCVQDLGFKELRPELKALAPDAYASRMMRLPVFSAQGQMSHCAVEMCARGSILAG